MSKQDQAVIETAKACQEQDGDIATLSTGVRVRLKPVSPSLLAEVVSRVVYPEIPTFHNEGKGRDEENPHHPAYLAALAQANQEQGVAMMDALSLFGLELLDEIPDDGWDKRLHLLGIKFDLDDPVEREFYYKKHVAMTVEDFGLLKSLSGVTPEGVSRAEKSFQRDKKRKADKRAPAKA